MSQFLGEFICKVDAKGRLLLPAGLKKQLSPDNNERFVVNRGFEQCLTLYPYKSWETISAQVNKLNMYVKKNRNFVRYFYRGATELTLDGNGRILLPKTLCSYAEIDKELVLFAYSNRIEIWNKKNYDNLLTDEPDDFADLAEDVMGNLPTDDDKDLP